MPRPFQMDRHLDRSENRGVLSDVESRGLHTPSGTSYGNLVTA